jgi:hypothetical protein
MTAKVKAGHRDQRIGDRLRLRSLGSRVHTMEIGILVATVQ